MTLTEHAERELREAGMFDDDSPYAGEIGNAVMELIRTFAAQGHSGQSAAYTISLFKTLASYGVINPLKNPMEKQEYIDHSDSHGYRCFQSTRKSSVFSEDGGKTWYDIDKRVPWWKRMLGIKRHYISFASTTD